MTENWQLGKNWMSFSRERKRAILFKVVVFENSNKLALVQVGNVGFTLRQNPFRSDGSARVCVVLSVSISGSPHILLSHLITKF